MASRFYSGIDSRERSESRERGSGMLGLVPCMQTSGSQGRQPIEGRVEKGPLRELFHLFSGEPGGRERGASGQGADSSEPTRPVFSDKVNESSRIVSEIRRLNERLESKPDRVSGSSTVCATGSGSVRERSSGGEPWRQRKVEENTKQTAENTKMLIERIELPGCPARKAPLLSRNGVMIQCLRPVVSVAYGAARDPHTVGADTGSDRSDTIFFFYTT